MALLLWHIMNCNNIVLLHVQSQGGPWPCRPACYSCKSRRQCGCMAFTCLTNLARNPAREIMLYDADMQKTAWIPYCSASLLLIQDEVQDLWRLCVGLA